jgi:GGDEF domain-containing protein
MDEPPELTEENVFATLERVRGDAGMIFKRGIAVSFSRLEKRFKTHDGWKLGSRVILDRVFDENGWWNYHRGHEDTMNDIERVFTVLDGKSFKHCEINAALRDNCRIGRGPRQAQITTTYFTVRVFKNGNAHLWFTRDDLVAKVNKLIGEFYGNPIPEDRGEWKDDDGVLHTPKTSLAKGFGFYPTTGKAIEDFFNKADISLYRAKSDPPLRILEPSAGTGNLARRCLTRDDSPWARERQRFDHVVDCVEIQPDLSMALKNEGVFNKVWGVDFLALDPATTGLYDMVVMNPPFDRERDIDHIMHAFKFLKEGGTLHAIMSAGTEFRETRKSIAFRALIERLGGYFRDMPPGSFSAVGTNVNTICLKVTKRSERMKA